VGNKEVLDGQGSLKWTIYKQAGGGVVIMLCCVEWDYIQGKSAYI
jgi:hypothetical protein